MVTDQSTFSLPGGNLRPRPRSLAILLSVSTVITLLMSACSFTLASNAAATSPRGTVEVDYRSSAQVSAVEDDPNPGAESITGQAAVEHNRPAAPPPSESRFDPAQPPTLPSAGSYGSDYYVSGFACTGSMRPTIDCGDEGVFVRPPFQHPPQLGDVISFSSDPDCRYYKNHNISKAHRITAIRSEDGIDYYTTKGDAAQDPDPCETTLDQIDGKLVEVRKGARPLDVIDTTSYELAKEWVKLLKVQYEDSKADFDRRKAEYDAKGERYQEMVDSYKNGDTEYETVLALYQQLEAERVALNLRKDYLNSLGTEINAAIAEVDRLYQELFIQ